MIEEKNKKKILYVVEDEETAQFRYRVKNVAERVEDSNKYVVNWVLKKNLDRVSLDEIDIVVVLRQTGKDKTVLKFIDKARGRGIKVLFDLDDLIFDYMDLPILMRATGSKNIFYWMSYVWGIRRIAKKADGFIATNDFLGKMLMRTFDKPYVVIPNSLNTAQVELAQSLLGKKTHDGFTIGYFSGSPTHARDFKLIESQIVDFLNKRDDAKFLMVGYMEFSNEMLKLKKAGKAEVIEFVDYLKMLEIMAMVDINIAPLVINDFTNSKSELKFFEAGLVETVTIASPTYAYKKAINDGGNGILAKPDEWFLKMEDLYKDNKERKRIAKNARETALKEYYGKNVLKKIEEAYEFFG